jgi:hypothetical protein
MELPGGDAIEVDDGDYRTDHHRKLGETVVSELLGRQWGVTVSLRPRHWRFSAASDLDYCVQSQGSRASILLMG